MINLKITLNQGHCICDQFKDSSEKYLTWYSIKILDTVHVDRKHKQCFALHLLNYLYVKGYTIPVALYSSKLIKAGLFLFGTFQYWRNDQT